MRSSEITPELIELSKRAKKLGFPQDVEVGLWVMIKYPKLGWKPTLFDIGWDLTEGYMYSYSVDEHYNEWFLILSFSRCLEWLREKGWTLRYDALKASDNIQLYDSKDEVKIFGELISEKTHHEAIAKAVVKMLEGENNKE